MRWAALLWAGFVAVTLYSRPLMPASETRLASVAWEMWDRGSFLVPYLNGEPYSEKPPLLFWLIHAGWAIAGVNEMWARLVPSLLALATLFAVRHLARLLWPGDGGVADLAAWLALASACWAVMATIIVTDVPLVLFVLLALAGVLHAWRGRFALGWLLFGLATGLGVLTKGPVILLHTVPVAILAPWWSVNRPGRSWASWYGGVAVGVALGAAVGLAWAVPAAAAGGADYGDAILWTQTTGRITRSFAHEEPWWWYLPLLPVLFLPFPLWPPVWRALMCPWSSPSDAGVRFCVTYLVLAVVAFSAISGKQLHYLLPAAPVFACVVARALGTTRPNVSRADWLPVAGVLLAGGLAGLVAPFSDGLARAVLHVDLPPFFAWLDLVSVLPGLAVLALAIVVASRRAHRTESEVRLLAVSVLFALACVHLAARPVLEATHDLGPVGRYLRAAQDAGRPVAHLGYYRGQFHFAGRLRKPLEVIHAPAEKTWIAAHPDGLVVTYDRTWRPGSGAEPELHHPYRGDQVLLLGKDALER